MDLLRLPRALQTSSLIFLQCPMNAYRTHCHGHPCSVAITFQVLYNCQYLWAIFLFVHICYRDTYHCL
ncbi:hypothetical protein BDR04DRAFT_1085829 [Suillus decipiens]|nr:hypothetical protein BDR04DRAFT_1085829 [Suillus decipiens]